MKNVKLYLNTIKYLRLQQILYQIFRKLKKWNIKEINIFNAPLIAHNPNLFIEELDLDEKYLNRFDVDEFNMGIITLLNHKEFFDGSKWDYEECSPLWNFNLQYFEYGIALAVEFKKNQDFEMLNMFKTYWKSWLKSKSSYKWHPYTISLRIKNLLIIREIFGNSLGEDFDKEFYKSIYNQYRFLECNQEKHILGNHYFENLCTLVICSDLFGEQRKYKKYLRKFLQEIKEEILPDGMHFEKSFMYHKLILEDLFRIRKLDISNETSTYIDFVISKMCDALATGEKGFNRTPLFNDSGDNVAKNKNSLLNLYKKRYGRTANENIELYASGYYQIINGTKVVLIDAGTVGPDYIPGHVQCDALSFEVCIDGEPLFVNSGTGVYQGKLRKYFRSTEAHNTITINGHQQSECWSEHRVGRRISEVKGYVEESKFNGLYRNYLGERHKRKIEFRENSLYVLDSTEKTGDEIASRLHIAPEYELMKEMGVIVIRNRKTNVKICSISPILAEINFIKGYYAPEFEKISEIDIVEFKWISNEQEHGYLIKFI